MTGWGGCTAVWRGADMVSAFCALGGNPDKTGEILAEKLREVKPACFPRTPRASVLYLPKKRHANRFPRNRPHRPLRHKRALRRERCALQRELAPTRRRPSRPRVPRLGRSRDSAREILRQVIKEGSSSAGASQPPIAPRHPPSPVPTFHPPPSFPSTGGPALPTPSQSFEAAPPPPFPIPIARGDCR